MSSVQNKISAAGAQTNVIILCRTGNVHLREEKAGETQIHINSMEQSQTQALSGRTSDISMNSSTLILASLYLSVLMIHFGPTFWDTIQQHVHVIAMSLIQL